MENTIVVNQSTRPAQEAMKGTTQPVQEDVYEKMIERYNLELGRRRSVTISTIIFFLIGAVAWVLTVANAFHH